MAYKKFLVVFVALFMTQMLFRAEAAWTSVPGTLTWVSVGDAGEMWGVNSAGAVYKLVKGLWALQRGWLKQISVGTSGVWGVNANNDIWRFDSSRNDWTQMPGKAIRVSSGSSVWAIDAQFTTYRFSNGQWLPQTRKLMDISVSDSGAVWGVNSAQQIYRLDGTAWTQIPGVLVRIAVGKSGVWGIDASQRIFQYISTTNSWSPRGPGSLVQIDSGSIVLGVNSAGLIYRWT